MGLPVVEARIVAAEPELGRKLPAPMRERLMLNNGGEVETRGYPGDDQCWQLHPVFDSSDRKRAARSAGHIVNETREGRARAGFPDEAVVIAANGTGDLLVLLPGDELPHWWDHETAAAHRSRSTGRLRRSRRPGPAR